MTLATRSSAATLEALEAQRYRLTVRYPLWLHPVSVLLLLTGLAAAAAMIADGTMFREMWRTPKFLTAEYAGYLTLLMLVFAVSILIASGHASRRGEVVIDVTGKQREYLRKIYRVLFWLTIAGYAVWIVSAVRGGVGLNDLTAVIDRELGAVSSIKARAAPIGGVTTLTQFGPIVVAIGVLLNRLGHRTKLYWLIILLSIGRVVFYAERLALIEVLVPLLLTWALTIQRGARFAGLVRVAPLVAIPILWGVFAASEYQRSWIYYETVSRRPFEEWVTFRLLGYYTTAFNNSALFADAYPSTGGIPYFTVEGLWNAPVVDTVFAHPGMYGASAIGWWTRMLETYGNREFNNPGSFLVTWAELGPVFSIVFWIVMGVVVGLVYARMTKGSIPAFLAVTTLLIGILELSRFMYWTQGRALPVLLALVVIAFTYPKGGEVLQSPAGRAGTRAGKPLAESRAES